MRHTGVIRLGRIALATSCAAAIAAAIAATAPLPADLRALLEKARLEGAVTAWCSVESSPAGSVGYAVALSGATRGGRYLVIGATAEPLPLATYSGDADLSCYSPADAKKLDRTIRSSRTIHGAVSPKWKTSVVCGFVEDTKAVCWQYSPHARAFVRIGGWLT